MELLKHNSVGQLAKTYFPTLKPLPNGKKTVGRNQKKTSRTHARRRMGDKKEPQKIFRLKKAVEFDFIQTIPLLFDFLDNTQVIFHNNGYVNAIFSTYHSQDAFVFLQWVKTFAIMRLDNREQVFTGVIKSNDSDFLRAYKLIKLQAVKLKDNKKSRQQQKQQIWKLILKHYPNQPFNRKDMYQISIIGKLRIRELLNELQAENKLIKHKKKGAYSMYQVIKPKA